MKPAAIKLGRTIKRKLIGSVIVTALLAGHAAFAQTVGLGRSSSVAASPADSDASSRGQTLGMAWPAPVGHRQPQAKDLPSQNSGQLEQISEEDRAVDRKLSICRGC